MEEAAKDKHILRQKITCLENLVAAEASLRLRAEKQRDDVQALQVSKLKLMPFKRGNGADVRELQERTVLEMHRQAGLPKGLMGEALQEALKGRDERLVALESIVAEESVRAMEREEKLQLSEMERRDMQGAFMLVFEHLKEGAGSGAQAWLKRFSGRAWFARAQVYFSACLLASCVGLLVSCVCLLVWHRAFSGSCLSLADDILFRYKRGRRTTRGARSSRGSRR